MTAIEKLIHSNRIIVCCGSGGVGKTTTSAAIALKAASLGKKTVVITIDPAKRLATSLGLKSLESTPSELTERVNEELLKQGQNKLQGRFFAVMPDSEQTFENFVKSMAGDDETLVKRVFKTSIYKIFTREFAGANEYMAMEKLFQLHEENNFDLIVLDTPPSANTRVFLEAPRMLADFFDDRIMRWFVNPGTKILATGLKKLMEVLERLTGRGFIAEMIEFTTALFDLRHKFLENLEQVNQLLHQSDAAFLMVTSPERLQKNDTQDFVKLLSQRGYRFWGFVVNRVLSLKLGLEQVDKLEPFESLISKWSNELAGSTANLNSAEIKTLKSTYELLVPTLEHEKEAAQFLKKLSGASGNVALVPEQPTDVHSVGALWALSSHL